jgi:hypothetical protein
MSNPVDFFFSKPCYFDFFNKKIFFRLTGIFFYLIDGWDMFKYGNID